MIKVMLLTHFGKYLKKVLMYLCIFDNDSLGILRWYSFSNLYKLVMDGKFTSLFSANEMIFNDAMGILP